MRTVQLFLTSIIGFLAAKVTSQTLEPLPESVVVEKNDDITFTCKFSNIGGSSARFIWFHEDRLVSFNMALAVVDPDRLARYSLQTSSSRQQFSIRKVIASDGGIWRCEPTIGLETFETETRLVVKLPPSLVSRTRRGKWTPQLGSSLELYCNASGNPKPNVTWTGETRANGIVLPDGTVTEHVVGNVLTLRNVSGMHHGKYICHANNGLKPDAYAEYTVNVPHAPSVTSVSASSVPGHRYQMIEITCIVSSFPQINRLSGVSWTKDGVAISNNANGYEYSIIESTDDVRSKSILAFPKMDNTVVGTYTCAFTNTQGMASASINITVDAGPATTPAGPANSPGGPANSPGYTAGSATTRDTGASTSGVAHISAMAYLDLVIMAAGTFVRFIW